MNLPITGAWRRSASAALALIAFASSSAAYAENLRMLGYLHFEEEAMPTRYFPKLEDWQNEYIKTLSQASGGLTYKTNCLGVEVQYTIKPSPNGVILESNKPNYCNHVEYRPAPLLIECIDCLQALRSDQVTRQSETDYLSPRFPFARYYVSDQQSGSLGAGWRSTYHRGVRFDASEGTAIVGLSDGDELRLSRQDKDRYTSADGNQLVRDGTGWRLKQARGGAERFDAKGLLIETITPGGYTQRLEYQNNLLTTVRDSFGATFRFEYRNGLLSRAIAPAGATFDYTADAKGNLSGVTRSDGSKSAYAYGHASISSLLTAVDHDGQRFRHYSYDAQGRAVSSVLSDGSSGTQVEWLAAGPENAPPPGSRPIPTELKQITGNITRRTLYWLYASRDSYELIPFANPDGSFIPGAHPTVVMGEAVLRPTEFYKICPATSCPGLYERRSYDEYGRLLGIEKLADTGESLTPAMAVQGTDPQRAELPLQITEGFGTPLAATTNYTWHPQFSLPTGIARPGQTEALSYDAAGLLTVRTVTDPATGAKREWQYTYGAWGTLTSMTDPAKRITRYGYDASGNLTAETDGAGNVTRFSDYDVEGRIGKITRPDGVVIALGYDKLGRLNSRNEGGLITRTDHTPDGRVARVSTPDGRVLTYGYDKARRLASVTDNVGGRIEYQRDGQGRIVRQQLKDNATAAASVEGQQ